MIYCITYHTENNLKAYKDLRYIYKNIKVNYDYNFYVL